MMLQSFIAMSFRAPRLRKRASRSTSRSASPSKVSSASLISSSLVPKERRPRHSQSIFVPTPEVLVAIPGHDYSQIPSPDRGCMPRSSRHARTLSTAGPIPEAAVEDSYEPPSFDFDQVFVQHPTETEQVNMAQQRKRKKQWNRWMNEVIPSLLRPHLHLLRESASLRSISRSGSRNCTCAGASSRYLKVVCVHFESEQNF
jgi:hypothetical protein